MKKPIPLVSLFLTIMISNCKKSTQEFSISKQQEKKRAAAVRLKSISTNPIAFGYFKMSEKDIQSKMIAQTMSRMQNPFDFVKAAKTFDLYYNATNDGYYFIRKGMPLSSIGSYAHGIDPDECMCGGFIKGGADGMCALDDECVDNGGGPTSGCVNLDIISNGELVGVTGCAVVGCTSGMWASGEGTFDVMYPYSLDYEAAAEAAPEAWAW